ncbi:glycoside hydrolase family 88 protein [Azospirillum sp. BE72]|uniref:glycoside hydrolase family 88 protein n=1 Tax=Azospirillum sp. BE72 TaxID=2817776 RepID=UPI002861B3DE|nr:glycoside hydrolase family 88 protein [Azospirillum sp. BE72]MDR6775390.1 unsaturated chondroitin disaccharide hydrolase [Azospirillum sp. BE72]
MIDRTNAIARVLARVDSTLAQPGSGFPHYADPADGVWVRSPAGDWTGGFWCGMLWLAALRTGDTAYRDHARDWASRLRVRADSNSVFKGFLFWYGAGLGDVLLGDPVARDLAAAGTAGLMRMYNPRARLIPLGTEAEEAFDVGVNEANIDALPGTIALLLSQGGDAAVVARNHLLQHVALCVRDDGSVCQSASFDPETGALLRRYTHKGIHENSTWGRAQGWAMIGLAQALARGETEFRADAVRVADWWLANIPADGVAFWDFDDPAIPATERDSSATAIGAAALLKLAALIPEHRERYEAAARKSVDALVNGYLTPTAPGDARQPGILTEGCFNKRNGAATAHELIWGDYFLFEALLALEGDLAPERL